jgi:hypothetical protein
VYLAVVDELLFWYSAFVLYWIGVKRGNIHMSTCAFMCICASMYQHIRTCMMVCAYAIVSAATNWFRVLFMVRILDTSEYCFHNLNRHFLFLNYGDNVWVSEQIIFCEGKTPNSHQRSTIWRTRPELLWLMFFAISWKHFWLPYQSLNILSGWRHAIHKLSRNYNSLWKTNVEST